MGLLGKLSFKDQAFRLREDAILDATTQTLTSKGFDLMTMDDVANLVGISKPSLYKHFKSKDDLVAAAMVRLIDGALAFLDDLDKTLSPIEKLRALLEWALRVRLEGGMPFLPSTSPQVRAMLLKNLTYIARVLKLNGQVEGFIKAAQKSGELNTNLPVQVMLFSYYSRTCDPAVEFLQLYSKLSKDEIVERMLQICFEGMGKQ